MNAASGGSAHVPGDGGAQQMLTVSRNGNSIVAADLTYGNCCFGFRWWVWRNTFFR